MTTRGTQTITWDVENRPISVTDGVNISTFVYDGDGNRVKKTEGGETILYINQYYEKNLTTGEVTSHYYHGGKLVAMKKNTTLQYIHQDHLSGTALATSANGSSLGTITYYPYGSTRSGDVPTDKKFTGQRLDGTGLYYYNARYYDASIGRFISADTIVQSFTNPQALNRYSYVFNNPLRYTDPSGLKVEFENEEYILALLEYGMYYSTGSLLDEMIQEWAELRLDWEEFKENAPKVAEMLEESKTVFTFKGTVEAPGHSTRSVIQTMEQVLFDAVGYQHTSLNTLLGLKLATMSGSASLRFGPGGTFLFEGIEANSATGILMSVIRGNPITVGYCILTTDLTISQDDLIHELGHVTQAAILGSWYLPAYVIDSLIHPKWQDKWMEGPLLPNWPRR